MAIDGDVKDLQKRVREVEKVAKLAYDVHNDYVSATNKRLDKIEDQLKDLASRITAMEKKPG